VKHSAFCRSALAVAVCLGWGSLARADYIAQFNFTPDKADIFATNDPTLGKITLSNQSPAKAEGGTFLIATNITTSAVDTTSLSKPAVFKNAGYTLTLFITDLHTGKSDQMFFSGKFNGTVSTGSAQLTHTFTSPQTVSKQIGFHLYTVTVGSVVLPGNPTSGKVGSIGAVAIVTTVPEPSSLALAGLGLTMAVGWRLRRRPRTAAASLA
jgi:hypothetical protein